MGCYNLWANLRCSRCLPLGKNLCEMGRFWNSLDFLFFQHNILYHHHQLLDKFLYDIPPLLSINLNDYWCLPVISFVDGISICWLLRLKFVFEKSTAVHQRPQWIRKRHTLVVIPTQHSLQTDLHLSIFDATPLSDSMLNICSLDHIEQILKTKYNNFNSTKCFWKCQQNGCRFASASAWQTA